MLLYVYNIFVVCVRFVRVVFCRWLSLAIASNVSLGLCWFCYSPLNLVMPKSVAFSRTSLSPIQGQGVGTLLSRSLGTIWLYRVIACVSTTTQIPSAFSKCNLATLIE